MMSFLVSATTYFYTLCSYLASGIDTVKDTVQYVAGINYSIVAAVLSALNFIFEYVCSVVNQISTCVQAIIGCVSDFIDVICSSVGSFFTFCDKMVFEMYSSVQDVYTSIINFTSSVWSSLSDTTFSIKASALDIYDSIGSALSWSAACCVSLVTTFVMFLASVSQFCVGVVTGAWQGLGFVLASIAYAPVYFYECIQSLKDKMIESAVHGFTVLPKETYLGIICLCLLYFTLSNAVRYISGHGLKIFSMGLRSRRPRPSFDWQFDQDFESDLEDAYGNGEGNEVVWMIPGTAAFGNNRLGERADAENEPDEESDTSDSETVDGSNDVSDDSDDEENDDDEEEEDEGSEDGFTVISDDSDSDTSLNSRAVSVESSEQDIEISLPNVGDGYSLRSRSSTPSSVGGRELSSPEEFTREMEREKDKRKCVVCQDQIKSVLVMPCRHMCLCVLCADQIVRSRTARRVCPLCRARIEKVMNVYV